MNTDDIDMPLGEITHQCPYCELKFSYMTEVKDHILHDHKEHAAAFQDVQTVELPHGS